MPFCRFDSTQAAGCAAGLQIVDKMKMMVVHALEQFGYSAPSRNLCLPSPPNTTFASLLPVVLIILIVLVVLVALVVLVVWT